MSQIPPAAAANSRCAMEGGDAECWCASLPPLMSLPAPAEPGATAGSCFCPACLQALLDVPAAGSPPRVNQGTGR